MSTIADNIASVRVRIARAATRCGLEGDRVDIVAVTKTRSIDEMEEAARCDVIALGENRVQEALSKWDPLASRSRIPWHLVGHLQKNKVKYLVGAVALIHSVDSVELMEAIQRRAAALGTVQDVTRAFMFLADPDAGFITGQTLFVCGGASIGTVPI